MKTKDRIINEIENLTEDTLGVILKFIHSLGKTSAKATQPEGTPWGAMALDSGAFDFWLDPDEMEYSKDDLKDE